MSPSGLKVFDVIGRSNVNFVVASSRRAVNRHSVVTSVTSPMELRATKVSGIISKLYIANPIRFTLRNESRKYLFRFYERTFIHDFSLRQALIYNGLLIFIFLHYTIPRE